MKRIFFKLAVFLFFFNISFPLFSQSISSGMDEKMAWWREARFGMFIHWGVYAVFANQYDGLNVLGEQVHYDEVESMPSEWIMSAALIPRSIYREAAQEFDANNYDPKLWVQIAKDAGMKYIVITTKHHDGFCLFDTPYTDWNAVDASAAKRDLLKELVDEAKAAGLKIGFYYSQNIDWMHEGGMGEIPELNMGYYSPEQVRDYVNNFVIPQIQELAAKYDFDIMWFDGQGVANIDTTLNKTILKALKESPVGNKIITNDRLYIGCEHDFETPESDSPDIPYNGYPNNHDWEACASLNNSWGYEGSSDSLYWKSPTFTIGRVLELSSKGGNFLLNVGPDKHGVIPQPAVNTLAEVGKWMAKNGEAVYGTERNELLNPFEYGYVTQKITSDGLFHWYLHISSGYWNEGKAYLYGIKEQPVSATYFVGGAKADIEWKNNILTVNLPDSLPDPYYTIVDLCFNHLPQQVPLTQIRNNQIRLTPYQAVTTNGIRKDFQPCALKEWYLKSCEVKYDLYLDQGTYTIQAEYGACDTGELYFNINDSIYTGYYSKTEDDYGSHVDMYNYITDNFTNIKIQISKPGLYHLVITRNAEIPDHFNVINVRNFTLIRSADTDGITIIPDKISLYPNPVRNGYFFCTASPGENIRIYDVGGRLLKSCIVEENQTVDVSDLKPGIYLVTGKGFNRKMVISGPLYRF